MEYKKAVLVIGDNGNMDLKKFGVALLDIEKTLRLNSYYRAFALAMGPSMANKKVDRPTLEDLGIDMVATVKKFKKNMEPLEFVGRYPSFGLILLE